ncbi:TolC family protein [Acidithiobacillus caldus]
MSGSLRGARRISIDLLAILWLAAVLSPAAQALDFADCVKAASQQNPAMLEAHAESAEAKGAVSAARGHLLPKLTASFSASQSNNALTVFGMKLSQRRATFSSFGANQFDPNLGAAGLDIAPGNLDHPSGYHNFGTKLQLDIPIWNGGAIRGGIDQATAMLRAAQNGDRAAQQKLIFALLQAYDGVVAAQSAIEVAEKAQQAAAAYVKTSRQLLARGVIVKSDLLSAEVHQEEAQLALRHAQDQKENALENLAVLIGRAQTEGLEVGAPVMPAFPEGTLEQLQAEALADNAGIQALREQLKAARAGVTVARAAYLPHVNAMANQEWNGTGIGNGAPSYTVGGEVSWAALDFSRGGQVDSARAKVQLQLAKLQQAEDHLRVQLGQAWRAAHEASARVKSRELAVRQAEEAQRLLRLRYDNGVETLTGLLRGQAELDRVRAELVQARYDEAVERAALWLALGKLELSHIVAATGASVPQEGATG